MFAQDSNDYFDRLSKYYRNYSERRRKYLDTVDDIVISSIRKKRARTLLDIGSGDGVRAVNIAKRAGIKNLFLVDPSIEMMNLCKIAAIPEWLDTKFYCMPGEELTIEGQYEAITCLWNVIGHIPDKSDRIKALKKMGSLLTDKGSIYLDVNNRYNVKAYGLFLGGRHILRDIIYHDDALGDIMFEHKLNGELIKGSGHLFSPKEIELLIQASGLKIIKRLIIDYKTGKKRKYPISGQLLFELQK